MEIIRLAGIGLLTCFCALLLKKQHPEWAAVITLSACVLMLLTIVESLFGVVEALQTLAQRYGIEPLYITTIFKIIGIAYIAEFGAQICRDAEQSAVADKVELAGKVMILSLGIPVVLTLLELGESLRRVSL